MSVTIKPTHASTDAHIYLLTLLAFGCIYFIWGSTYLAIRYAVETVPPFFVAGLRHSVAGILLFAWCWWRGLRPTRGQWFASLILGFLFFLIGHGTLHWAEQTLPSGLAAMLISTEPIIVAVLVNIRRGATFTPSLLLGLILGVGGVALLVGADVQVGRRELISSIVVLLGAVSWSIGILYSGNAKLHPDRMMTAAMTLLAGAVLLLVSGAALGEAAEIHFDQISLKSVLSILYLAIAGSLVTYAAYFWLLDRYSPTLISTHTYINPLVALILGWAIAGEKLSSRMFFAATLVVLAIVLVGRSTGRDKAAARRPRAEKPPQVEPAG